MILLQTLLLLVIYFDAKMLRRENDTLFQRHFYLTRSFIAAFLIAGGSLLLTVADKSRLLIVIIFIFLLPFYLFKRQRFLSSIEGTSSAFWTAADCFSVVLYWIFGGVVIATLVSVSFQLILEFESVLGELLISAIGSSFLLMYLIYKAGSRRPEGFLVHVGLRRNGNSILRLVFLPVVMGIFFAILSSTIIYSRETTVQTPLGEIISQTQSSQILVLFLGMAVGAAPLIEEIVFRGYFFRVLHELRGPKFAIILISLSFALLHVGQYWGDWMAILMITLLGFGLSGLRALTGSTIPSSVMHYAYNISVVLVPVVMMAISNPAFFEYQLKYGQLSYAQKEALLKTAVAPGQNKPEIYFELALLYAEELGRLDQALSAMDQALTSSPDNAYFLETKASILEKMKRYGEALEIRRKLMEKPQAENPSYDF